MRRAEHGFFFALLTEVAKILVILLLILSVEYLRSGHEPGNGTRAPSFAEQERR